LLSGGDRKQNSVMQFQWPSLRLVAASSAFAIAIVGLTVEPTADASPSAVAKKIRKPDSTQKIQTTNASAVKSPSGERPNILNGVCGDACGCGGGTGASCTPGLSGLCGGPNFTCTNTTGAGCHSCACNLTCGSANVCPPNNVCISVDP